MASSRRQQRTGQSLIITSRRRAGLFVAVVALVALTGLAVQLRSHAASAPPPPASAAPTGASVVFTPLDGAVTTSTSSAPTQVAGWVQVSSPSCPSKSAIVLVDGTKMSSTGQLNTGVLTNGQHLVQVQGCGQVVWASVISRNHLNPYQAMRNSLFSALRGHPSLMNAGLIFFIPALLAAAYAGYRWRDYRASHRHNQTI